MTDAVQEYRRYKGMKTPWSHPSTGPMRVVPKAKADAAIAALEAENSRLHELAIKFAAQLIEANVWDAGGWTPEIMAELEPSDIEYTEGRERERQAYLDWKARAGKAEALLEFALEEWERGEIPPDDMADLAARYERRS